MTLKINQNGSSLVEVSVALPVILLTVAGVMATVYLLVAQGWLRDSAEDAAICVAETSQISECKKRLKRKTSLALPIGDYTSLSISYSANSISVAYEFASLGTIIRNKIYLSLPVAKRQAGL